MSGPDDRAGSDGPLPASADRFETETAFLFPGQGSQRPGMSQSFYEECEPTRELFAAMDAAVDVDLPATCFEGDAATLRETRNTQPAVFAAGLAAYAAAIERLGRRPHYVTGHSLGQYTALAAAGGVDPATGADLVRTRGEVMSTADGDADGRMVAVLLADPETVADACVGRDEVSVAGFNGPKQTVVSGAADAVDAALAEIEREASVCRSRPLDVELAFHSPLVAPARRAFEPTLEECPLAERLATPVVSDTTATIHRDPADVVTDLRGQITAPIDWTGAVRRLGAAGVEQYVEFPPAGTLADLVEAIDPDARVITVEDPDDLAAIEL